MRAKTSPALNWASTAKYAALVSQSLFLSQKYSHHKIQQSESEVKSVGIGLWFTLLKAKKGMTFSNTWVNIRRKKPTIWSHYHTPKLMEWSEFGSITWRSSLANTIALRIWWETVYDECFNMWARKQENTFSALAGSRIEESLTAQYTQDIPSMTDQRANTQKKLLSRLLYCLFSLFLKS